MKSNNPPPQGTSRLSAFTLLLALLLSGGHAMALSTDKDQPIEVEADGMEIDDRTGVTIYTGNVEMQQGSIRLKADKVTIHQNDNKDDRLEAEGNPVRFRQRPDGKKEDVKGHALRVHYYTNSELIYFIDDAVLFPGDGHKLESQRITYDRVKAVMKAGAAVSKTGKAPKKTGRIRTTIAPRKQKTK